MVNKRTKKKPRIPKAPMIAYVNFTNKRGGSKAEANRYAIFAAAVYKPNPEAYLKQFKKISWIRDNSLSNANTSTFYNPQTREVIMSFRGTNWGKISDIWQNIGILTGNSVFKQRLNSNFKLFKKVEKKYGKQSITLTGHSAGGYQAAEVAMKYKVKAVVFNAANNGSMKEVMKALKAKGLVKSYTTTDFKKLDVDVVSLMNPHPNETIAKKQGKDAHTIDNFIPNPEDAIGEGIMGDIGKWLKDTTIKEGKALLKTAKKEGKKFLKKEGEKLKKKAEKKAKEEGKKLYDKGVKKVKKKLTGKGQLPKPVKRRPRIKPGHPKNGIPQLPKPVKRRPHIKPGHPKNGIPQLPTVGRGKKKKCKKCNVNITPAHWQRHINSKGHKSKK